jgi:hypothetical protein
LRELKCAERLDVTGKSRPAQIGYRLPILFVGETNISEIIDVFPS